MALPLKEVISGVFEQENRNKQRKKTACFMSLSAESFSMYFEGLKSQGHRLILLSNTCEVHFNYAYSHFPILRKFDDRILSYEVQMRKPDKAIYQKALFLAQSTPSFYVDDIPEYVASARRVGLNAMSYQNTNELKNELQKRRFLT